MAHLKILNPKDYAVDIIIENVAEGLTNSLTIQPHGRPDLPEGWEVSAQSKEQFPFLKIHSIP